MAHLRLVSIAVLLFGCQSAQSNRASPPLGAPAASGGSRGFLEWRGGPTAVLEHGGVRLLTDPMLGPRSDNALVLPKHPSTGALNAPVARYTAPPTHPVGHLDLVVLSHNHADHFDQTAKEVLPKDVLFVLPASAVPAVKSYGFFNLRPLNWNEETVIVIGRARLRILAVRARHAHDQAVDASVGKGNGYVLAWEQPSPFVVYWTGDAVLTDEMRRVAAEHAGLNLFLPHLGAVGVDGPAGLRTMDAAEAVEALMLLKPQQVIPIHHTTFSHYREPVSAFVERAQSAGFGDRLTLPVEGKPVPLKN